MLVWVLLRLLLLQAFPCFDLKVLLICFQDLFTFVSGLYFFVKALCSSSHSVRNHLSSHPLRSGRELVLCIEVVILSLRLESRSPDPMQDHSSSRSPSRCGEPEDQQEKHMLADIIYDLRRLRRFVSSRLGLTLMTSPPPRIASTDMLTDMDNGISSSSSSMHSKKVYKLLPNPGIHNYRYNCFEGGGRGIVKSCSIPRAIAELEVGPRMTISIRQMLCSCLRKQRISEAASRTIIKATMWMGWWTYSAKSLS